MESIWSADVCAQFRKCQLIPAFKSSLVTLHAGPIETTIEAGVESFLGNNHVRDLMSQSTGLRLSSASCCSPVNSTERRCPVDPVERLWLEISESDGEASKASLELVLCPGTEAVVETRVESSKMTKNGIKRNASSGAANGVEVSKLTSVFMPFQFTSRLLTERFDVLTMQKSGDTASRAGVWIITSSMGTVLVFRHSLFRTISTCFNLYAFSAENSKKKSPYVGEGGLCVFSQGLFDEVSNWLSYHNLDFIDFDSTVYITTPHKVAKSKLVESVLGSGGSDI